MSPKLAEYSDEHIAKTLIGEFNQAYGDPTNQLVLAQDLKRKEGWNIGDLTDEVLTQRPRILEIITTAFIGKHRGQKDSYGEQILPENPDFKRAIEKSRTEIRMIRSLLLGKM